MGDVIDFDKIRKARLMESAMGTLEKAAKVAENARKVQDWRNPKLALLRQAIGPALLAGAGTGAVTYGIAKGAQALGWMPEYVEKER